MLTLRDAVKKVVEAVIMPSSLYCFCFTYGATPVAIYPHTMQACKKSPSFLLVGRRSWSPKNVLKWHLKSEFDNGRLSKMIEVSRNSYAIKRQEGFRSLIILRKNCIHSHSSKLRDLRKVNVLISTRYTLLDNVALKILEMTPYK